MRGLRCNGCSNSSVSHDIRSKIICNVGFCFFCREGGTALNRMQKFRTYRMSASLSAANMPDKRAPLIDLTNLNGQVE
jgi:hypothetical protein